MNIEFKEAFDVVTQQLREDSGYIKMGWLSISRII